MSALLEPTVLEANEHRARLAVMNISYATDLWLGELARLNHSERTVTTYRRLLNKFAEDHPRYKDVRDITATDIRQFLDTQAARRDGAGRKSASTIAQNVSILNGFFDWLTKEGAIDRNPTRRNGDRILARPKMLPPEENDNVTTVSTDDVIRLLETAERSGCWSKRLAVGVAIYSGARRRALAQARIGDYDPATGTLAFFEKGGKLIRKPVPDELGELIERAIRAGVYTDPTDYLIPSVGTVRGADRDDRIVWRLVKDVAADAGVTTHVHALRAAYAVKFLEQNPGDVVALQKLMGHRRGETTNVYLRRLDRQTAMETVRSLSWAKDSNSPQNRRVSGESSESSPVTEKEGFEPSKEANPLLQRDGSHSAASAPGVERA
jgi:integrase